MAFQEKHRRKVALKVVKVRRDYDENLWHRFLQESAMLSAISHENIVRVYDRGFGNDTAYIAMEHLGGGTLRAVIDKGVSHTQALELLSQALAGLSEIHRRGVVHRDITPANLMLRSAGALVLTDFGVARRLNRASETMQGEILGTPYYLSPEQAENRAVVPATDLYSLGVIYFEMLTGCLPYRGKTISEILAQHLTAPVPRLPAALSDLQHLIDGMLAKRVEDRFPDAATVLLKIGELRKNGSSALRPSPATLRRRNSNRST
jgi:serine/threonine protein kinase